MPIGNIIKFWMIKENYKTFKHEIGLHKALHIFELPALGLFTDASAVKAFYAEHSLTDELLSSFSDDQKLFIIFER